ncbi:MAG: hypothetical protein HOJ95_00030 [Nitrospinaceae bacterium]|jgi:hypothetical protein|nr:hypothetical protein [Rhodospirillaceae bacterium]MBT6393071.1 hypothetical protein [Nitrospinaceae bacterium]
MTLEFEKAEMIRKADIYQNPQTPSLALLRLETDSESQMFLVTREILKKLSAKLAEAADSIEATQ